MPFLEHMIGGMKVDGEFVNLPGFKRFRPFKTLMEPATKNIVGDHKLVTAHFQILFVNVRINVDQFYNPVAVRAGRRRKQIGQQITRDGDILGEHFCFPTQYIGAIVNKPLVLGKPGVPPGVLSIRSFNGALPVGNGMRRV